MTPLRLDTIDIISPGHYQAHGYPHDEWALLRREAPLYWYDRTETQPFWAVTKHADVVAISKQPRLFRNGPRLAVFPELIPPEGEPAARHLLNMDPPEHGKLRRLVSRRFTPRGVKSLVAEVDALARGIVDELAEGGLEGECDFVTQVSAKLPLAVIAEMLGVPREDREKLFRWTNELIGTNDPDYQLPGESGADTAERARVEVFEYFMALCDRRRREPRDDLVSALANAEVDGGPLPARELLSYFMLLVVAGNETTRNATSGGLRALIENPGELEKLRRDPSLLSTAVEEIVRYTTPVIQFTRTAVEDTEVRGRKIRAGESLCLFYPSANRDEEVFDEPFAFRVDRQPNPHLAFGIGEHHCLGAHLARLELRCLFAQLVGRLEHAELAGEAERLRSSFVGGIKRMPIRYRLKAAG